MRRSRPARRREKSRSDSVEATSRLSASWSRSWVRALTVAWPALSRAFASSTSTRCRSANSCGARYSSGGSSEGSLTCSIMVAAFGEGTAPPLNRVSRGREEGGDGAWDAPRSWRARLAEDSHGTHRLHPGKVAFQFLRQRVLDDGLVGQLDGQRMEPEAAGEAGYRPEPGRRVSAVAHNRMAQGLQVAANLVFATGLDGHLKEGEGTDPVDPAIARDSGQGATPALVGQGMADGALAMRAPMDHDDIGAMGLVSGQPAGDLGPQGGLCGAEHQPRGGRVQAVDGTGARRQVGLVVQPGAQVGVAVWLGRVHAHAGGLVHRVDLAPCAQQAGGLDIGQGRCVLVGHGPPAKPGPGSRPRARYCTTQPW